MFAMEDSASDFESGNRITLIKLVKEVLQLELKD